jgi:murein DD-endopeptidase MepM/ murein hydrolase activator NlpD
MVTYVAMPATLPGDGMPQDKGTPRPPKPPAHVPTFVARGGGRSMRLVVLALVVVLVAGTAAGLLDGGAPDPSPTPVPLAAATPAAVASPAPTPSEPADDGPIGAPLPATPVPTIPPKEVQPRSVPPEQLTGFVWPLRGARVTSRFGERSFGGFVLIDGREVHDGLDLARFCGFRVRAAHDGVVLYAGRKFDDYIGYKGSAEGIYSRLERQGRLRSLPIVVVIDYGNGYRGMYVHLSRAEVEAGDVVKAGDVIGREGATGYATGCHLHYTLIRMDGGWQEVVPHLHQYGYPALVRERVDPLLVLPWGDAHAPERLRERVGATSPSPDPSPSVGPTPVGPGLSPGTSPAPTPGD